MDFPTFDEQIKEQKVAGYRKDREPCIFASLSSCLFSIDASKCPEFLHVEIYNVIY